MTLGRKKNLTIGIVLTAVLLLEISLQYVPMAHTRLAVLSESAAEKISGDSYTHSIVNPAIGTNLSAYGANVTEYASYTTSGERFGAFIETAYMFNSTSGASMVYQYFAQELTTNNMNHVGNSAYRGFSYSYMIHLLPASVQKGASYYWGVCGLNGQYVFDITGYSHLKPAVKVTSIAIAQINAMEVASC